MINGKEYLVTTVNGFDRVQINNKLHDIGEVILNLRMEQDRLVQMRNLIDLECEKTNDLFEELFSDTPLAEEVYGG
jgi:predicted nuclease with TOPRIM domain